MSKRYIIMQYARYPIYEPAEGGYYYSGLGTDYPFEGEYKTKREACERLKAYVEKYNTEENLEPDSEGYMRFSEYEAGAGTYEKYIGDGIEIYVEREDKIGSREHGYEPYC